MLSGVALLALAGPWCATQFVAHVFDQQPVLGRPIAVVADTAVYPPTAIFDWNKRWRETYPRPFAVAGLILLAGAVATGAAFGLLVQSQRTRRRFGDHGWARFADVAAAGLFATRGTILGRFDRELLVFDGEGHQLLIGPSRKGKGRSHVVPTLLAWPHSAIVTDLKGELAQGDPRHGFPGTMGFRAALGPTIAFAPTKTGSARWNPLFEVRRGLHEVGDVQNLVEALIGPPSGKSDPFWDRSAALLLTGVILHVLYAEPLERKTLAVVREKLSDIKATVAEMRTTLHRRNPETGAPEVHPEVLQALTSFMGDEERLQSSIRATAHSYFGIFADPIVAANTATSDFRLADLVCGDRPMTLFLQPPPQDLARFMPMLRFMAAMTGQALMADQVRHIGGAPKKHRLLFLLDEFPLLGRLDFIEKNLGAMAGFGLKALLVCQSPNHIRQTYGRDNAIVDNCQIIAAFGTTEPESADWVSALAGKVYDTIEQVSRRRARRLFESGDTVTFKEEDRPLISAKEVQTLPDSDQLIIVQGVKPILAKKIAYDREPVFRARLQPAVENRRGLTTTHDWERTRALGRLIPDGNGGVRVEPAPPAPGEAPLSVSDLSRAGLQHPPPPSTSAPAPPAPSTSTSSAPEREPPATPASAPPSPPRRRPRI
jgi:type IV secretion system protein VirD4